MHDVCESRRTATRFVHTARVIFFTSVRGGHRWVTVRYLCLAKSLGNQHVNSEMRLLVLEATHFLCVANSVAGRFDT